MSEPDFESVPSWGWVIVTGVIAIVALRIGALALHAALFEESDVIRWLATTGTLVLGIVVLVAGGYSFTTALTIMTHFDSHRQIRTATATKVVEEARQTKYRTWEMEDELGLDLDGDGVVGEPETRGLIAGMVRNLFRRREPAPRRPRTNRYAPKPAASPPRVSTLPLQRAAANLAQFIKDAWMLSVGEGKDPTTEAPGLTRRAWGLEDAGQDDPRRKKLEACILVLRELGIIEKEDKGIGRFTGDLNQSLATLREDIHLVNIPAELRKAQPMPIQAKGANTAKA